MGRRGSCCGEGEDGEEEGKDEGEDLGRRVGRRPAWLGAGAGGETSTNSGRLHQRLLDRSKVKILLCDGDAKSSKEVFELLCRCSYQVMSVRTARQVIDALNAQGSEIDILLSEVDLPVKKGLKMLKHVMRNKELRHIPVVMMSSKDEVSVVVKCLRLGAADYLVKPLRTNELLNLWTHVWRRRRMLGLAEMDIMSHDFDLLLSDPSDGNTNSTLLSDDTDDRSKALLLETGMSNLRELQSKDTAVEVEPDKLLEHERDIPEGWEKSGRILSCPKKSELKIGESSAFFTYVKSSVHTQKIYSLSHPDAPLQSSSSIENDLMSCKQVDENEWPGGLSCRSVGDELVNGNHGNVNSLSVPMQLPAERHLSQEEASYVAPPHPSDGQVDVPGVSPIFPMPYYFPGLMRQNVMHSCPSPYQAGFLDGQMQGSPAVLPQYNPLPQCTQVPMISSFPYYPFHLGMQPEQVPSRHLCQSVPSSYTPEVKSGRIERREAALIKFRQKRKDRCFDKKIRYVNRKRLAERRPRVRGQFVSQLNGVNVDLNGCRDVDGDFDDYEDDDDDEPVPRDIGPDHDTS
uniref:Two-component response regulator-like PRR1 n=1 Tax=Anthurium amnicola TaxID=1678845 RepID=A0A1D1XZ17_9ARAE